MKQTTLIPHEKNWKTRYQHGGALLKNKRKSARPVSTKKAMHFVLRSSQAKGKSSFLRNKRHLVIESLIRKQSKDFGVRVYQIAVNSNHIHLLVRLKSRVLWKRWLRAISGLIVRKTMNLEKGHGQEKRTFWDARPWSRIVEWGSSFSLASGYVRQNFLEAWGFIPYQPRNGRSGVG